MTDALERFQSWLDTKEGENFEFKEAKNSYNFSDLLKYCSALSNEGGGRILLGITNKRPRRVVGSQAFSQPEDTRRSLMEKLRINVDFEVIRHPNGRVLAFSTPSHPIGLPVQAEGIAWMRSGDRLVPLSEERRREIYEEAGHDFSADICPNAAFSDLNPQNIEIFRRRWIAKSANPSLNGLMPEQLLRDAEAIIDGGITYAALILFGTHSALGRYMSQAELVFEFRTTETPGPASQRIEYRQGFFSFYDDLWNTINLRNTRQHYQDGLFMLDIPTFDERSAREALLNAISHRDYRSGANVLIRQYPDKLVIESPGGFPPGISLENILDRQYPRNRRIAEIFGKCGLVERSGQGMNLMFEEAIRHGKIPPDFSGTDHFQVTLTLNGQVRNPDFVRFLEKVAKETDVSFTTQDFLILDRVHRELPVPEAYQSRVFALRELGILETIGRGRSTKYILSQRFYTFIGKDGQYTRKRGLDRDTNKSLLLKHLERRKSKGCKLQELAEVLPFLSRRQVQRLLGDLKEEKRAYSRGLTNAGRWYPGSSIEEK